MVEASSNVVSHFYLKNMFKIIKYDLKQNVINCGSVPSLQYIMLNKIAVDLWISTGNEIGDLGSKQFYPSDYQQFLDIIEDLENKVIEKAFSLTIPIHCKETLKPIINSVGFEIIKYFSYQMQLYFSDWNKLKIYWNNLIFTDEGYVNQLRTAIKLLESRNLSTEEKYIIACHNCLEDKIRAIQPEISPEFINSLSKLNYYYEDAITELSVGKPFDLVLFWTFHVRGEYERFSEITSVNIHVFILKWAITYKNEVAVQSIWETIVDESVKENISGLIHCAHMKIREKRRFTRPYSCNIILYLLKKNSNFPLKDLNSLTLTYLIWIFNRISKLLGAAPNIKPIYDLIKRDKYYDEVHHLIFCWESKLFNLEQYKNYFEEYELRYETDLEFDLNKMLRYSFGELNKNHKENMITFKLLLRMISNLGKKEFLYNKYGVRIFVILLNNERLDILSEFINNLLTSEEEILNFKEEFFNNNYISFFTDLICKGNYEFLNAILNYFFVNGNKSSVKQNLLYKEKSSIVFNIIKNSIYKNVDMLSILNNFLFWSFDNNKEETQKCKTLIFGLKDYDYQNHSFSFCKKVKQLIKNRKWDSVDKYWRWIFFAAEDKICTRKEKILRIKRILYLTSRRGCCGLFKRFAISNFDQDEVQKIKNELASSEELLSMVEDMLKCDKNEKVDEMLEWCYSNAEAEIDAFKEMFLFSKGCEILFDMISEPNFDTTILKSLFKWLNPSLGNVKNFEKYFLELFKQKKFDNDVSENIPSWESLQERALDSLELLRSFNIEKDIEKKSTKEFKEK